MQSKNGFTKMSILEFEKWINTLPVSRAIKFVQLHHTYIPSYVHFDSNHFERQASMKADHLKRGFNDIAQHFTTFPDGSIVTGRSLNSKPAGITGNNEGAICIENLGNFDLDKMTTAQADTIVRMVAALCKRFHIPKNEFGIVYHHWFNMNTGERNNGIGADVNKTNKTCPGVKFFGGNSVQAFKDNFLPLLDTNTRDLDQLPPLAASMPKPTTNQETNYLPYVVGGATVLILIALGMYFLA